MCKIDREIKKERERRKKGRRGKHLYINYDLFSGVPKNKRCRDMTSEARKVVHQRGML